MHLIFNASRRFRAAVLARIEEDLQRRYGPYLAHFHAVVGYHPSVALPTRYHEKMLWRKIFDHSPVIAKFCDKLATKDYIAAKLPDMHVPRTLWVGDCLDDIPKDLLSEKIMLKCNHGCAFNQVWIRRQSDFEGARTLFRSWLAITYGTTNYEWGYSQVRPKVYAEEYIEPRSYFGLVEIKVRCCDGEPVLARVHLDGHQKQKRAGWFNVNGERIFQTSGPLADGDQNLPPAFRLPTTFFEAIQAARVLSRGIDYARFDFMSDGLRLLAGEITVYPAAGLGVASLSGLEGPDTLTSRQWDLRKSWFLNTPQRGIKGIYAHFLRQALGDLDKTESSRPS